MSDELDQLSESLCTAVLDAYAHHPEEDPSRDPAVVYHQTLLEATLHRQANGYCPHDGTLLDEIGSVGILDSDGRWEAQTVRFRCKNDHFVFVAGAPRIERAEHATSSWED
jgi:hypothetical protein